MPTKVWISRRNMALGPFAAKRGGVVPDHVIAGINPLRLRALVNVGHLAEVEASSLGEQCPKCGEGPFIRLAKHMTSMHPENPADVLGETTTLVYDTEVELDVVVDVEAELEEE